MLISPDPLLRPHLGDNVSAGQTDVSPRGLFLNHVRTSWGPQPPTLAWSQTRPELVRRVTRVAAVSGTLAAQLQYYMCSLFPWCGGLSAAL